MPLFLRALPLSFGTAWHYIFLLPLVVIACIPFMLLGLIPFVGWLVTSTIGTFISFAGFRCALTAYGRGNEPAFGKLVRSSFAVGLINTLASFILILIAVGIAAGLAWLGITPDIAVPGTESIPLVTGFGVAIYLVLYSLYYCAMAVPMTAVAAAATRNGRDPGPFFGFGAGIVSVLLAWVIWLGGLFYLGFFTAMLEVVVHGFQNTLSNAMGGPAPEPIEVRWWFVSVAVVYLLWGTCWFCATAVLAWDRKAQRNVANTVEEVEVSRISAEDLRALRESRMRRDETPPE